MGANSRRCADVRMTDAPNKRAQRAYGHSHRVASPFSFRAQVFETQADNGTLLPAGSQRRRSVLAAPNRREAYGAQDPFRMVGSVTLNSRRLDKPPRRSLRPNCMRSWTPMRFRNLLR
jgi:hypothetical protein